jgi:hypothetical protein
MNHGLLFLRPQSMLLLSINCMDDLIDHSIASRLAMTAADGCYGSPLRPSTIVESITE